jgi:hypothetical protein
MSAVNLDSLAPIISARGGRIVGIAPGPEAADDFIVETRWKHDLLIDEKRNVYKALNLKDNGIKECYGFCICCNSVGSWYKKASKAGFKNDLRGNKSQYGGTLLVQGDGRDASSAATGKPRTISNQTWTCCSTGSTRRTRSGGSGTRIKAGTT